MIQPDIRPVRLTAWEAEYYGIRDEAYVLNEPYEFMWQTTEGALRKLTLAAGLILDGASVPQAAWTLSGLTPDGLLRAAATLHDFLYMNGGELAEGHERFTSYSGGGGWQKIAVTFSRLDADMLFKAVLLLAGVSPFKAALAYRAVRMFGGLSWGSRKGRDLIYVANKAHQRLATDPAYADSVRRKYSRPSD